MTGPGGESASKRRAREEDAATESLQSPRSLALSLSSGELLDYWVSIPSTRVPSHRMEEVEVSRRWLGFVLGGLTGKYLPSSDISWPSMQQHKTMWMRLFNCSGRISEQHIGGEEPVDEETLWAEIKVVCSTSV